jgi:hypothetical protein
MNREGHVYHNAQGFARGLPAARQVLIRIFRVELTAFRRLENVEQDRQRLELNRWSAKSLAFDVASPYCVTG